MTGRGRGNVRVYIEGDSTGIERATKRAETAVEGLGGKISSAGDKMAAAGSKLNRGVTLPVLAVGAVAGKTAIDFDKSMRNVNSIAQLPEAGLKRLEGQVLSLAGPTAQAPRTLADGLYDLVSSGFDANESMVVLDKSARAATAGLTTTEVSTAAVAAVLNAYHLKAGQAGRTSDQLFETVNRGVISFEDLATNIGDVLPFSAQLGIGLGEVGASVATMTKAGISAPETMTRIKNVMVTLLKPGKDLKGVLKDMGTTGEELVAKKGFQGALEAIVRQTVSAGELRHAYQDLGVTTDKELIQKTGSASTASAALAGELKQNNSAVAELFPNIRALGGVLALTGINTRSANEDLVAFKDTSGATSKALSEQSKSASYKWSEFKSELEATAVKAAPQFLDAGKEIVGTVGDVVESFNELPAGTKSTIIQAGLLAAALGPVLTIGGNLLKVFGGIVKISGKTSTALRTVGYGAAAANTAAAAGGTSAVTGSSAGATKPTGRIQATYGTYDLARSFGRGRAASTVAQVGATGTAAAQTIAGGIAAGLGPAIAAAGIGNILSSALEGDTESAAAKAGGSIAGAIAGGIAGTFLGGNTALGAMIGGGVGSFVGDALGGLFDSGSKVATIQQRLEQSSEGVAAAYKKEQQAIRGLTRSEAAVAAARKRHHGASEEVKVSERQLQETRRKSGPVSRPAIQAEIELARAKRRVTQASNEERRAERVHGQELRATKELMRVAVLEERHRINVLKDERVAINNKLRAMRQEGTTVQQRRPLNERLVRNTEQSRKAQALYSRTLLDAARQVGPKYAQFLRQASQEAINLGRRTKTSLRDITDPLHDTIFDTQRFGKASSKANSEVTRSYEKTKGVLGPFRNETSRQLGRATGDVKGFESGTKEGFKGVETALNTALGNLGVKQVTFTTGAAEKKARGGGVSRVPGQGREDTVGLFLNGALSAMVAPGEDLIVANRHQRPELDFAVANTYGDRGLDGFFSRSNRPHNYAKGGIPSPQLTGTDPMQDMGQHSIDRVHSAAVKYLRKHGMPQRVREMLAFAIREGSKGTPYKYGGGHGALGVAPTGYDCSGYVSGILGAGHFLSQPESVQQGSGLYTLGQSGPGKWFTWGVRGTSGMNAHTMISIKDSRRGKGAWRYFESGSGHGAKEVGGWSGSFSFRHMPGFARGGEVEMPPAVQGRLAKYGPEIFDPRSTRFVGWGLRRGGSSRRLAGGGVVAGSVTWFNGGETNGGSDTSQPGLALNLNAGTDSGWDNPTTRGWMEDSRAGHPVYARVTVGGKSANLPITDLGPAGWTGHSIDVTEGGVRKLGFTTSTFPSGTEGKAVILGEGGGESAEERKEKTPVHGRVKLSYEEKITKADTRIARADTTATLKDDRRAAKYKLDLMRGRRGYLRRQVAKITKELKGKLRPDKREALLDKRAGFLSELGSIPGEASSLIEDLRNSGVGPEKLKEYAKGLGIGTADPNAEKVTARDRADLQLARAERTPDNADNLAALQKLVDISKQELKAAKKSGDVRKITEATRNLQAATENLKEATPTAADYGNRDLALAELTESTDDDRAALEGLKAIAEQQLQAALLTADPRDDVEAAQNLKGLRDSLDSLNSTISAAEEQRRSLEEERLEVDKAFLKIVQSGDPAMLGAMLAWMDGAMGGPLRGRNRLGTPGVPAAYQS